MDASQALINFSLYLSDYEKSEILEFEKVYFVNTSSTKTQFASSGTENNFGFDNEKGEFICEPKDHISYRYEVKKNIGNGSFGQVFQCFDHKSGTMIALKILRNIKRLHKQGLIEAGILQGLRDKDPDDKRNIVRIIECF